MTEAQLRVFFVGWAGGFLAAIIPWMSGMKMLCVAGLALVLVKLAGWAALAAEAKERKETAPVDEQCGKRG